MRAGFRVVAILIGLLPATGAMDGAPPVDSGSPLLAPDAAFWQRQAPSRFPVRVSTDAGDFVVEARRDWAPLGVDRFYNLVKAGFFDDSRFFRVRADYIAQFGIPGEPAVSALWRERALLDDPVRASNTRGTIAYAMTGPDTRTTQLYINLVDNTQLDAEGFAPIGEVVTGIEVVDLLYAGYDESAGGGMRRGQQDTMFAEGNAHLDRLFPRLSKLVRATVE